MAASPLFAAAMMAHCNLLPLSLLLYRERRGEYSKRIMAQVRRNAVTLGSPP